MEVRDSKSSNSSSRKSDSSTPDECILAHLESRTQLLQACLALRDAFTNKQRLRRLRALEKRRAEELANSSNNKNDSSGKSGAPIDEVAETTGVAAAATATASGKGRDNRSAGPVDSRGQQDTGRSGDEVTAASEGVAAMSIGPPSSGISSKQESVRADGGVGGTVAGETVSCSSAVGGGSENDGRESVERGDRAAARGTGGDGGGKDLSVKQNGCHDVELVVEGRGAATATGGQAGTTTAAPCAGGNLGRAEEEEGEEEGQRHPPDGGCDDTETPLAGIWRCADHLRAATVALERLLAVDNSLEPLPRPPVSEEEEEEKRDRPEGKGASRPEGVDAAATDAEGKGADKKKLTPKPKAFRLGGRAGTFAFEAEMNRHLLGSSPQHHVHFRRGRAEGPRALMMLAQEAERACGVVRCEDLLGVRRCLLRLFQPPATEVRRGGGGGGSRRKSQQRKRKHLLICVSAASVCPLVCVVYVDRQHSLSYAAVCRKEEEQGMGRQHFLRGS